MPFCATLLAHLASLLASASGLGTRSKPLGAPRFCYYSGSPPGPTINWDSNPFSIYAAMQVDVVRVRVFSPNSFWQSLLARHAFVDQHIA